MPTGENIFNSNKNFAADYQKLINTKQFNITADVNNSLIYSDIFSYAYNRGLYYRKSDIGYPLNRNPAFGLFRRDNKCASQRILELSRDILFNYFPEYMFNETGSFKPIFINSDYDLINAIIFYKYDNNNINYFNIHLENYLKNITIVTTSGEYITIEPTEDFINQNINSNLNVNYLNKISQNNGEYSISEILIGDDFTSFDNDIFTSNNNIQKVIIGRNITEIPSNGFKDCSNLNKLNFILDSSCIKINSNAFENCISLNIVKLPNSIETIESLGFANCSNLTQIQLSNNLLSIEDNAFQNTKITTLEFQKINNIGYRAFYNCNDLSSIIFNNTCTIQIINQEVFRECANLQSIILCSSITTLDNQCFFECENLDNINFDSNLTSIGLRCFKGCNSLQNVNLYNTNIVTIEEETFIDCSNLNSCILPSTMTSINTRAFANCYDLSYIIINGSLTSITNDIFQNITHDVIIYYFSTKTNTSVFDNLSNKILIDFDNTIQSYNTNGEYYEKIYVEKNSLFKLNDFSINFYVNNFIIPYDISLISVENSIQQSNNTFTISYENYLLREIEFTSNNINISGVIEYIVKFGNDLSLNFKTDIIVLDNILDKPYINYKGNRVQYVTSFKDSNNDNSYNTIINYGVDCYNYNNIDISHVFINNISSNFILTNEDIKEVSKDPKFFVNYYYTVDDSYNYNIDYNLILFLSQRTSRQNLRIDNNYNFEIFYTNNIPKAKLSLRFENDGNNSVPKILNLINNYSNISSITTSNFLFPIFSISDISSNSTDLTPLNGPIIDQSYTLFNNSSSYYFTNRINSKILRSSELNIKNSYNTYNKIFNQKNANPIFKKEESWGFTQGLKANDYAEIDIIFNYFGNCKDIINGKNNNIFTKDNSFGIFIDNATSSYIVDGSINFYNFGYFREYSSEESTGNIHYLELYKDIRNNNYNDNVIHFQVKNDVSNIIINGPRHLIIEKNSYFEDFGVLYLDNITPSFEYYEFPINTYNSNSINLTNGIYEINYSIYPDGSLNASIDISRTIEIVDNNLYKPSIVLGNSTYQNVSLNNYPSNNLENYALDSTKKNIPLFSNLITYDLSQIGTYYEYFYTYDSSGNYASLIRTIKVLDNSFIDLNFEPNNSTSVGFNTETNNLVLKINNNGNLQSSNSIELNFKILHKEPRGDQVNFNVDGSFNYLGIDYYYDILNSNYYNYAR